MVQLDVAFLHISQDTDHLTSFEILFEQVVFNYVVEEGEAVLTSPKGSHNPVPLEDVLFEGEKDLIKDPLLLLIVDSFEIVDIRNKQYDFSDTVDDVEMVFDTFKQIVQLFRDLFLYFLRLADLVVVALFLLEKVSDFSE